MVGRSRQKRTHGRKKIKKRKSRVRGNPHYTPNIKLFGRVFSLTCGFCIAMGDEWKKIVKLAEDKQTPPMKNIGSNWDDEIKSINDQYDTSLEAIGLPTIYRIKELSPNKFVVEYYKSERTAEGIMKWLRSR